MNEVEQLYKFWQSPPKEQVPFYDKIDYRFQMDCTPIPFGGVIENSRILILMANPGFDEDYFRRSPAIAIERYFNKQFPFSCKNSNLINCTTVLYWEQVFRPVLQAAGKRIEEVSDKIAFMNLVPYSSKHFKFDAALLKLKSVQLAIAAAQHLAQDTDRVIVVARRKNDWQIPSADNVITFNGMECRGIHLHKYAKKLAVNLNK
jgi:hypothetical protein